MIEFFVKCDPVGQPRHRVSTVRGHARLYLPLKHPVYKFKAAIKAAFPRQKKVPNAIEIIITAWFARPKSKTRKTIPNLRYWHTTKPDADNILKAILDALNGLAWVDDCQIASAKIRKCVCGDGDDSGVLISIEEIANEDSER